MEDLVLSLLISYSAPGAIPPKLLAPAIMRTAAKYDLDALQLTRIILTESRGLAGAYNSRTQDHGLMQINIKTAIAYNVPMQDLYNWRINLDAGAKVLSQFDRICRYNVGTAKLQGPRLERCLKYERKLGRFL